MTATRGLLRLSSFALLLAIAAPGRAGMRAGAYVPDAPDAVPGVPRVAPTIAGEVVISFDGVVAPCAFEQTIPLRDEYLALGVRFSGSDAQSGGGILHWCSNFTITGYSGDNIVGFNPIGFYPGGGNANTPETLTFLTPVAAISMLVGSGYTAGNLVRLQAFNAADELVDESVVTLAEPLQPLAVSGSGIVHAVLSSTAAFAMDDLRFTPGRVVSVARSTWGRVKAAYR